MSLPTGIIETTYPDGRELYRLGTIFAGTDPFDVGAYTANGVNVPFQGWFQQWTFDTQPTVTRTPSDLAAANRAFSYGPVPGCTTNPVASVSFTGPMDSAGIAKNMEAGGERPDIGLVTDYTGDWLKGGSPSSMLDQAMAADSIPINFVDETTGKPIDKVVYPQANTYENPTGQGSPWFPRGVKINGYYQFADDWRPDPGHYPSLVFTAFQATCDPRFLYNLQHAGQYSMIIDAANCSPAKGAVISQGQTRVVAWGFRCLFEAHTATLDAEVLGILPADLHPSSYWKTLLDKNLAFYLPQISDPTRQIFRQLGPRDRFGPWQQDYLLTALAFGILTGHADWLPIYMWCLGASVQRNKGGSYLQDCYPTGWGTAYYLNAYEWAIDPITGNPDLNKYDYSKPLNWWTSFLYIQQDPSSTPPTQAQITTLQTNPTNGGVAMQGNEYNMTNRAVLVMADTLDKKGLAQVRATYPEFDTCLANANAMVTAYGKMNARQSVISTGGIIMPTAVTIAPGQKVHLDVTFTGGQPATPPTYTQTDATIGALSAGDMTGVLFTSNTKEGKSVVTAATVGANGPISAFCEVTVKRPLPTGIALTPGTIS